MRKMNIMLTGGLGYIGSHMAIYLIECGHNIFLVDNLSNSSTANLSRIKNITKKSPHFFKLDIRDRDGIRNIIKNNYIETIIHFAGLKSVSESELNPSLYYDNNVNGSISLFNEAVSSGIKNIVFSSSATVYGNPGYECFDEKTELNPYNVYGRTKKIVEDFLLDLQKSNNSLNIAILRYFNPIGAHVSGLIGEDPSGVPNNLMPFIADVASGHRDFLTIYGQDYNTPDGTGVRDYIHINDLISGHEKAMKYIHENKKSTILNLGTGRPCSVLELVKAFEKVSGNKIRYKFSDRRDGDLPKFYADPSKAKNILNWSANHNLDEMCTDVWRWQKNKFD